MCCVHLWAEICVVCYIASVWREVWCACAVVSFFCPVHSYISRTMETTSLGMLPCSSAEPEETSLQFPSPPHHTFLIALNNANYSLSHGYYCEQIQNVSINENTFGSAP